MPTSAPSSARRPARRLLIAALVASTSLVAAPALASADTVGTLFEAPAFTSNPLNSSIDGQGGWTKAGPFDAAITANPAASVPTLGAQSLRISNAVTSGSFGDQTFSPALIDGAGETTSVTGGLAGGARQDHFELALTFQSVVPTEQPGLAITVSPDSGAGGRMSFLRLRDTPTGLAVDVVDVPSATTDAGHVNFVTTTVASALDRAIPHSVRLAIDFVPGESNDVVDVSVDDQIAFTGTTWENYYRNDAEAAPARAVPVVDQMLLRASGVAAPATQGNGFLVDDVSLRSSTAVAGLVTGAAPAVPGVIGATGVAGPTGVTGPAGPAGPSRPLTCSGRIVRVLHVALRRGGRLLSARATMNGRALKVAGRRIRVDLRARPAGAYTVRITARYRRGATGTRTIKTTRSMHVTCV